MAKLDRECGGLEGLSIEIHAPAFYVEPLAGHLETAGAVLRLPLADVAWDEWPNWYRNVLETA